MGTFIVKMSNYRGKIHIGQTSEILTKVSNVIHSDTVFSAIINIYSLTFGNQKTKVLLEKIINDYHYFRVSSAFYYNNKEFFIPKPIGFNIKSTKDYKRIKKLKFIPLSLVENPLKMEENFIKNEEEIFDTNRKILELENEKPRVSIDRITNSSNIYYISFVEFPEDMGMWFLFDVDNGIEDEIKTCIRILGDHGIGGERTYGFGLFKPEFINYKIPNQYNQEFCYVNISLVNPLKEEIRSIFYYFIKIRKGYIYSPYIEGIKHDEVNVIDEGSVFTSNIKGRILDLTPSFFNKHRIYKYYRAFCLPFPKDIF